MDHKLRLYVYWPMLFAGLYIMAIYLFDDSESLYMIANGIFFLLLFSILLTGVRFNFKPITPEILLVSYAGWITLSMVWAWDVSATGDDVVRQILFLCLWLGIVNVVSRDRKYIVATLKWIVVAGTILTLYLIAHYGFGSYLSAVYSGTRIGEDVLQLNKLGMYTSTAAILSALFFLETKKFQYILLTLIPFLGMLGSGSKRAFLMFALSIILYMLLKVQGQGQKYRIIKLLGGVFIFLGIIQLLMGSDIFGGVLGRFAELHNTLESGDSHFSRMLFLQYGFQSFLNHPLLGLGSGNSHAVTIAALGWKTYLHNNYMEQLVNLGIVGFVLYYGVYFTILKRTFSLAKNNDICARMVTILLLSQLISDIAVTSYNLKFTYVVFAIGIATAKLYHHKQV